MHPVSRLICWGIQQTLGVPADGVVSFIEQHLTDDSRKLPRALATANDKTWKALAVALAGDGLFDRVTTFFARGEFKAVREEVGNLLAGRAFPFEGEPDDFRRQCLDELAAARRAGWLSYRQPSSQEMARFRRYADPQALVEGAYEAVAWTAAALPAECENLARLLRHRVARQYPLLASLFAYFFRREIEKDRELANGLLYEGQRQGLAGQQEMLAGLERLAGSQAGAFAEVEEALDGLGARFDELFWQLEQIKGGIDHVKGEQERQGREQQRQGHTLDAIANAMKELKGVVSRRNGVSTSDEREQRLLRQVRDKMRSLSPAEQERLTPEQIMAWALADAQAGECQAAVARLQQAARKAPTAEDKALAHYHAFQVGLLGRDWVTALRELLEAATLDPSRFAPFRMNKYEPIRILGSGGFGMAVLCRNRYEDTRVVVKVLSVESLELDQAEVFREARVLRGMDHPAIIRLLDSDYADAAGAHPYLVTDFFDGPTLADHVKENGPIPADEFLPLARLVAEGLHAAHERGVLHRDVTPKNILVRKSGSEWHVRLIDFGLALRHGPPSDAAGTPRQERTPPSGGIAGTQDYAAPEQMGKAEPGVAVGRYSDVYGFGKTCCYAVLGIPDPDDEEKAALPEPWRKFLAGCTARRAAKRLPDFAAVLEGLGRVQQALRDAEGAAARRQRESQDRQEQEEARRQEAERERREQEEEAARRREVQERQNQEEARRQAAERKRREQEEEAGRQRQELGRLRQEGEEKLARLVREALDRTGGKPTAEDTAAVNELVRQHRVEKARAQAIVREVRERWRKEQPPASLVVCASGDGYRSLADAIRSAPAGAEIRIRPGVYREGVVLNKNVRLIGDGPREKIVIESKGADCVLMDTDEAVVRGLTLQCTGGQFYGVDIPRGRLLLEDCDVTSYWLACVAIHGKDANPTVRNCKLHKSRGGGVMVFDQAKGTIEGCDIFANEAAGVSISDGGDPTVRDCRIHDHGPELEQAGIAVSEQGRGTVEGCHIFNNLAGVTISTGGDPAVRCCRICYNEWGVFVYGRGTVVGCDIFENKYTDVTISEGGDPTVRNCRIHDSTEAGVLVEKHGKGTVEGCDIFAIKLAGVAIKECGEPTLRDCRMHHIKEGFGVLAYEQGRGTVEGCDFWANRGGAWDIKSGCRVQRRNNREMPAGQQGGEAKPKPGDAKGSAAKVPVAQEWNAIRLPDHRGGKYDVAGRVPVAQEWNAIRLPDHLLVTVELPVPGTWYSRPADQPEAEWKEVASTPGSLSCMPEEVYRLTVAETATDAQLDSLAHLPGLIGLRELYLFDCQGITDAGLAHLKGLTGLRKLHLGGYGEGCGRVTDAGLAYLKGLTGLNELKLDGTEVTDVGLTHLKGLTGLQELCLSWCQGITDAGLAHIKGLTGLRILDLSYCEHIADAGLAHLGGLTGLQELDLCACERVTDAGLAHLKRLTALQELNLRGCKQVTHAGLTDLQAALPKCDVSHGGNRRY